MTALLVIIYLSFVGLGLPNSVLGSIWPQMQMELGADVSLVGYLSMTVTAGTVASSVLADRIVCRLGVARVTVISVLMTAGALLGFALSPGVEGLFLCALPMGLAAGAADVALNNFVALHYEAKHRCFMADGIRSYFRRGVRPVRHSDLYTPPVGQGVRRCGRSPKSRPYMRRAYFPPQGRTAAAVRLCSLQCDGNDRRAVGCDLCA